MQELAVTLCYRPVPVRRGERHIVASLLAKVGHNVTQVEDGPIDLHTGDVVWLMENAHWFPTILKQLKAKPKSERPLVILWHWEPLPPSSGSGQSWPRPYLREIAKIVLRDVRATDIYTNYFGLRQLIQEEVIDLVIVSSQGWYELLAERGISAHWVPIGYELGDGYDMGLQRNIDAFFLGSLDVARRKRVIKYLRRKGIGLLAKGSWFDPACWGESRTRLINQAKIFLNIQRQPGEIAGHRLILGMANKALVISEPIYNPSPFVEGKHYISSTKEDMASVIRYYLAHDDEREYIINQGHQFVIDELTMERSVSHILDLIDKHVNRLS